MVRFVVLAWVALLAGVASAGEMRGYRAMPISDTLSPAVTRQIEDCVNKTFCRPNTSPKTDVSTVVTPPMFELNDGVPTWVHVTGVVGLVLSALIAGGAGVGVQWKETNASRQF